MSPQQRAAGARKPSGALSPDRVRPAARKRPGKPKAVARNRSSIDAERRRAMIAEAAYFRAAQRGFFPGRELEDWFAAEAEVDKLLASPGR